MSDEQDRMKLEAAQRAVTEVESGMVVGLGTGTTAMFALAALAARVANGLRITGIPTSEKIAAAARKLGIELTEFAADRRIDLTIDGADQVERGTLTLVKGLGGALLREKIVAAASVRMIVVADMSKVVTRLGGRTPVPVEIVPFGWPVTMARLEELGATPTLRRAGGEIVRTDSGNYIADCAFDDIADAAALEQQLAAIVGVVESGIFIGLASKAIIGGPDGVEIIER
jgi:ribose 5-phosphate isomerase A